MEQNPIISDLGNTTGCKSCGAILKYAPGTNSLQCEYCGTVNEIVTPNDVEKVSELDFNAHTDLDKNNDGESHEVSSVKCTSCGAESTLKPNVTADECAFCGTALVLKNAHIKTVIKPKSVLPFKIDKKEAYSSFGKWLGSLWFAPNDLKKYAVSEKLNGIYLPYWTFDTNTLTDYTGEQGIDRHETEHYTTVENGQTVTKTRTRVVTDWYYAAGSVGNSFDDVLVNASHSLPRDYVDVLEPWDLEGLVPFNENYLAGFRSESYQVGLKDSFELAKNKIKGTIDSSIRSDIGGDRQRIHSSDTTYSNTTFKHTLLPLWISSFRYRGKSFRFLINARTGETKGDRPYSWMKIAGTVISGIITICCFGLDITTGIVALAIFLLLLFKVFK
ncbi:zinc finger domain-containing protein [Sporocytophaga myxococcoides]|uniref:zinc finger domain-containing protein n=1 Tax=Sporocytophaga myxococcoides TaxID=153721 RepID=UPI0004295063|nr:hypothetical protein [Sporocytophaga myxococcoides]